MPLRFGLVDFTGIMRFTASTDETRDAVRLID